MTSLASFFMPPPLHCRGIKPYPQGNNVLTIVSEASLSRRGKKLVRFYEQARCASRRRVAKSLAMWLGWVVLPLSQGASSDPCDGTKSFKVVSPPEINQCSCANSAGDSISWYNRTIMPNYLDNTCGSATNMIEDSGIHENTNLCEKALSEEVAAAVDPNFRYVLKNTTESDDYYACTTDGDGYFVSIEVGLKACSDGSYQTSCTPSVPIPASIGINLNQSGITFSSEILNKE